MSAETLDPRHNVFYCHSYIFTFGVPVNDMGGLAILHVNNYLDLYGGVNRGVICRLATTTLLWHLKEGLG